MTETGNYINRVLRQGCYGGCLVARGPKGALSEEVTFKLSSDCHRATSHVKILARTFQAAGRAGQASITRPQTHFLFHLLLLLTVS